VKLETGEWLKVLRTNGGGEYIGENVQKFLKEKGIWHKITTPDTPQHNSVTKHMNQTLVKQVRTMLFNADVPESYWFEALQYAALLYNMSPTHSLDESTPNEAWSSNKPDISRLRMFGSCAFMHIPDKLRNKFTAKSLVCTFLGYACQQKAYRLVHRALHHFLESHNVIFDEGGATPHYKHIILKTDNAGDPPPLLTPSPITSRTTPTSTNSTTP